MNASGSTFSGQFLTFKLDEEMFALNVSQVREVLELAPVARVPMAPEHMKGVINVRGSVVPVMDLKLKFGLGPTIPSIDTRIIVMEIAMPGETLVLGAMADSVREVIELDSSHMEAPPRIGARWKKEIIQGIGKKNNEFIIMLNIDKVFSMEELSVISEAESHAERNTAQSLQ